MAFEVIFIFFRSKNVFDSGVVLFWSYKTTPLIWLHEFYAWLSAKTSSVLNWMWGGFTVKPHIHLFFKTLCSLEVNCVIFKRAGTVLDTKSLNLGNFLMETFLKSPKVEIKHEAVQVKRNALEMKNFIDPGRIIWWDLQLRIVVSIPS